MAIDDEDVCFMQWDDGIECSCRVRLPL